jgi:hypothetical protein
MMMRVVIGLFAIVGGQIGAIVDISSWDMANVK